MHIVLAPDSFKDAASAVQACRAMAEGVRRGDPQAAITACPIADGGEGFVDALLATPGASPQLARVTGPRGDDIEATWALLDRGRVGVVELAQAAGLERLPAAQRNPWHTTTFGVGQMITAALDAGATRILLGVGGSMTNDAGCGMAQALGARFFDDHDALITSPITGGDLQRVRRVDLTGVDPRLTPGSLEVACDVTNPLYGPHGAAHVYARQKGADDEMINALDAGLRNIESVWRDAGLLPGTKAHDAEGFGAAGGTAGGAVCMLNATLRSGAALVLDAVGFDELVRDADLVLTGEGRLDGQSLSGKAVLTVARRAAKCNVPTIALVGSAANDADRCVEAGLHAYEVLAPGLPADESIARTAELLANAAERVVRKFVG